MKTIPEKALNVTSREWNNSNNRVWCRLLFSKEEKLWEIVSLKTFEGEPRIYGRGDTKEKAIESFIEEVKNWNAEPALGFVSYLFMVENSGLDCFRSLAQKDW